MYICFSFQTDKDWNLWERCTTTRQNFLLRLRTTTLRIWQAAIHFMIVSHGSGLLAGLYCLLFLIIIIDNIYCYPCPYVSQTSGRQLPLFVLLNWLDHDSNKGNAIYVRWMILMKIGTMLKIPNLFIFCLEFSTLFLQREKNNQLYCMFFAEVSCISAIYCTPCPLSIEWQ